VDVEWDEHDSWGRYGTALQHESEVLCAQIKAQQYGLGRAAHGIGSRDNVDMA
jgi:hypothetical protein